MVNTYSIVDHIVQGVPQICVHNLQEKEMSFSLFLHALQTKFGVMNFIVQPTKDRAPLIPNFIPVFPEVHTCRQSSTYL